MQSLRAAYCDERSICVEGVRGSTCAWGSCRHAADSDPAVIVPRSLGSVSILTQCVLALRTISNYILSPLPHRLLLSAHNGETQSLLVADEFHLLEPAEKRELFLFFAPRVHWLKVLLIGNRKLDYDSQLVSVVDYDTFLFYYMKLLE